MSDQPLAGVRVVDFSWNLPGPYATWVLAGLGAEVRKVEPKRGDPARGLPKLFAAVNAGKHSTVIDRDAADAADQVEALIRWADVLVEGFRPGKIASMGADYERASAINPRLIYCSLSAYGQDGPRRDEPGHDLNAEALSGALYVERDRRDRPRVSALPVADLSAGLMLAAQINAALLSRERTGRGARLDVSMVETVATWAALWGRGVDLGDMAGRALPPWAHAATGPWRRGLTREGLRALPHYDVFRCACGGWLALGLVDEDVFWKELCADLGLGPFGKLSMPARAALGRWIRPLVARGLRRHTREAWLARWQGRLPATPVLTLDEVKGQGWVGPGPFRGAKALAPAPALGRDADHLGVGSGGGIRHSAASAAAPGGSHVG
jgi:crotonobetainyl-CoA:carnitine CoA-transferase CaiB-like acyl-CoA transferase